MVVRHEYSPQEESQKEQQGNTSKTSKEQEFALPN